MSKNSRENPRKFKKKFSAILTKFLVNSYNFNPGGNIFGVPQKCPQIFLFLNFMRNFERLKKFRENLKSDPKNTKKFKKTVDNECSG